MLRSKCAIASSGRAAENVDGGRGAQFLRDGSGRSRVLDGGDARRANPRCDAAHRRDAHDGRRTWIYPPTSENCWRSAPAALRVIDLSDLIANKRAVARPQDLIDADFLERVRLSRAKAT